MDGKLKQARAGARAAPIPKINKEPAAMFSKLTRREERSRATRESEDTRNIDSGVETTSVPLSSLGIKVSVKQGDRKRESRKQSDAESEGEKLAAFRSSFLKTSEAEGEAEKGTYSRTNISHRNKNMYYRNFGRGEEAGGENMSRGRYKDGAVDPDETPTQANYPVFASPPHPFPRQQHSSTSTFTPTRSTDAIDIQTKTPYPLRQAARRMRTNSDLSAQSLPVQGINDYNEIARSPEKALELRGLMASLNNVFGVEEWDPELPPASQRDASPERLELAPEPLTYTTVGSVARPSAARQFSAPHRIQREGRAGLEAVGRRPMLPSAPPAPRTQEFFAARNSAQYATGQNYAHAGNQDFVPESPVQYQSSQRGQAGFAPGQSSSMANYASSQAGAYNYMTDRSLSANQNVERIGLFNTSPNPSSATSNTFSTQSTIRAPLQLAQQSRAEKYTDISHILTPLEVEVFKSLNLPLPTALVTARQEHHPLTARESHQMKLTPDQEAILAGLKNWKSPDGVANLPDASIGKSTAGASTFQRPAQTRHHEISMSASSSNGSAHLQQATMPTLQRLSEYPNPNQEHAKAILKDLAATMNRANEENQRPVRLGQSGAYDQQGAAQNNTDVMAQRGGGGNEMNPHYYADYHEESELDYNFRFPNSVNRQQQQPYANLRFNTAPAKTPQGYPQPLTAGPPGQRQNNTLSSNKALNSMQQQMFSGGNQRAYVMNQPHTQPQQMSGMPQKSLPQTQYGPPQQQHFQPYQFPHSQTPASGFNAPTPRPDPALYPWGRPVKQPRATNGPPLRIRQTLGRDKVAEYYPDGMDRDTAKSFLPSLTPEEISREYPDGLDEETMEWYKTERKFHEQPDSDLDSLLSGHLSYDEWIKPNNLQQDNFSTDMQGAFAPTDKETIIGNVRASLQVFLDKTPENIAMLEARGIVDAPKPAFDYGPNGNDSFFTPGFPGFGQPKPKPKPNARTPDNQKGVSQRDD